MGKNIGIVVGRFQVPKLTVGHMHLLSEVSKSFDKIIVFVGETIDGKVNKKNPLPVRTVMSNISYFISIGGTEKFETKKNLAGVFKISDVGNYELWTKNLDKNIESLYSLGILDSSDKVTLCGSRDSFLEIYTKNGGIYSTTEISSVQGVSGTKEREKIVDSYDKSFDKSPNLSLREKEILVWFVEKFFPD